MIYAATTIFDNNHLANFTTDVNEFTNVDSAMQSHYGEKGVFVSGSSIHLDVHIKKIRTLQGNGFVLVCMNNNKPVFVARFVTAPVPQGILPWSYKVYTADRVKIHPKWAGRGVCGAVYTWLSQNGYTVLSDSHQTQASLAVWKKLAVKNKVYMIDVNTMAWKPYDPTKVEDWVLFGNGNLDQNWPIRLVLPAEQT